MQKQNRTGLVFVPGCHDPEAIRLYRTYGDIAIEGTKGGGSVNVPGPTPQQIEAQNLQNQLLKQQVELQQRQYGEQQVIAPMLYQQMGYTPQYDSTGKLTGLTQTPEMAAQMQAKNQINEAYNQRQLAALRGELPVDPGLMIDLNRQEAAQKATLASQFGQGGQGGTGATQSMDTFNARKMAILEGARRGDLTLAEQLGASEQMQQTALMQRSVSGASAGTNFQTGLLGNLMGGVQSAQIPISTGLQEREMGLNAAMFNARNRQSAMGGIGGVLGAVGGAALGSYFGNPMAGAQLGQSLGSSAGRLF